MMATPDAGVLSPGKNPRLSRGLTFGVALLLVLVSTFVMLACASPELCWDEADYAASLDCSWRTLWSQADYCRHGHGPMLIYLAKLGQDLLPASIGSLESRLRFFDAFVASLAVGVIYASLRHLFRTSHAAALVGASLFLFSGSRVVENNIIGPHGLMVVCTVALVALGFHWRNRPSVWAALGLALVIVYGALTMSYIIPAVVGWVFAVAVAGKGWFGLDRSGLKVSWYVVIMAAAAALFFVILWPGGTSPRSYAKDFLAYVFFPNHCLLVGNTFYETAPRWTAFFWLANLDPVLSLVSLLIFALVCWRIFHGTPLTSRHAFLAAGVFYLMVTSLTAHLGGARNLLQFLGVLSLATGALFDEALGENHRRTAVLSTVILVAAGLGLLWVVRFSSYTPFLATDGYQACLEQNQERMNERVGAVVYGKPDLTFYSRKTQIPVGWNAREMECISTRTEIPLPPEIKYVLLPSYVDEGMPPDHTMRRVVAATWKVVWSYKSDRVWALRLYERPSASP